MKPTTVTISACLILSGVLGARSEAHEQTKASFLAARAKAQAKAAAEAAPVSQDVGAQSTCRLKIRVVDETGNPVAALVRVRLAATDKVLPLKGEIHRAENWHSLEPNSTVLVPQAELIVDAIRGLHTKLATAGIDLRSHKEHQLTLQLETFYDPDAQRLYSGNTHLHLMKLTHAEADRYLRVTAATDDLDLVFLSYLRRIPDERDYISNEIVLNSFAGGDLARLSQSGSLFVNGQEHRHNFGRGGEGYGHVMLLNLQRLVRPVSIGPGIMARGTDGRPLQAGIREARADGATVIWCHNTFGFEDIPNWAAGLIDAQNIFDGGNHGSYADTFYRYLNLGLRVPFSTGTDWFIYDFSRVYVPLVDQLRGDTWLRQLADGRSFITNGPLLEFEVEGRGLGETLELSRPRALQIRARALGRVDFRGLELIYNGRVLQSWSTKNQGGHFVASIREAIEIEGPGWLALRIPVENNQSELGRTLFAHTSPIYISLAGNPLFDVKVAEELIKEVRSGLATIQQQATFADDAERDAVLQVYHRGIEDLQERIRRAATR